ncbi:MAG: SH3 domain-containing protein, partial [Thermomicrobiales bacterium]
MHPTAPTPERSERPVSNPAGRFYRATTALTIFAMLFGGLLLLTAPAVSARSNSPVTTAWVNFRTGPSTSDAVIMVLPDGTSVDVTGDPENGFYPVNAKGSSGFVSSDFISFDGGSTDDSGSEAPVDTGNAGTTMYVIDGRLNLRDGPGTNSGVITVMPGGAAVTTTGQSSSGFLSVSYNGREGWAFAEFLSNSGGGDGEEEVPEEDDTSGDGSVPVGDTVSGSAVVADGPLNLRAGPSTSTSILNVMPTGSSIELMGSIQSGFHPVRYQGQTGWAFAEFVGVGGTTPDPEPAPEDENSGSDDSVPVPGSDVVGTAMVIAGALNLRSGPSTSTEIV